LRHLSWQNWLHEIAKHICKRWYITAAIALNSQLVWPKAAASTMLLSPHLHWLGKTKKLLSSVNGMVVLDEAHNIKKIPKQLKYAILKLPANHLARNMMKTNFRPVVYF